MKERPEVIDHRQARPIDLEKQFTWLRQSHDALARRLTEMDARLDEMAKTQSSKLADWKRAGNDRLLTSIADHFKETNALISRETTVLVKVTENMERARVASATVAERLELALDVGRLLLRALTGSQPVPK